MTKTTGSLEPPESIKEMEEGKVNFESHGDELETSSSINRLTKNDKRLAVNRTISFHDGQERPSQSSRAKRNGSSDYSSSIEDTEDEEEDDDLDLDDDDDDTQSNYSTDASFMSEEEPDDKHRKSGRFAKLTPKSLTRRRERRRRERQRYAYENSIGKDAKVYRRMPVLTGVIAPFSIMLEIPGFTSRWYISVDKSIYRPNPIILDVGLAISLFCAIVANLSILGRFAERIAPRRSTIVAGTCLILHDIINAVALITFGVVHAVNDGFTYSEAYWMTTAATAASLICTTSLIIDYCVTKNFKNAGSGLTPKQAQLVMVIMAFLAYISISAMIFALILPLPFLEAMYFSVETLATIGLGDITPTNLGSRVCLFFIAPGGIVLLAVVVAIARQTIIEEFEAAYKKRRAIFKQKAAEKKEEKRKNRHLRVKIKKGGGGRGGGGRGAGMTNLPANLALELQQDATLSALAASTPIAVAIVPQIPVPTAKTVDGGRWWGGSWNTGFSRRGANIPKADLGINGGEKGSYEDGKSEMDASYESTHTLNRTDTAATNATQLRELELALINQRQGIENSFKQFRLDLAKQERNEFWTKLGVAFAMFACFWLLGGAIFSVIEGWTYFQGFYFVFVIFSTIGYGDSSPKSSAGRAFFIVWALFGVGTLTILFSVVSDAWANRVQQRKLAGEKVVKKPSLWSKMSIKVKGKKGRERLAKREREEKEATENQEIDEKGDVSPKGSVNDSQETAISINNETKTSTGGILIGSNNGKDGLGSKNGSVEEITASPVMMDESEEPMDIKQLHLDFTAKAMEFNMSALDSMQNNRTGLMEAFRHVPEMREALEEIQLNQGGKKKTLAVEDRKLLVDRIKLTGDVEALHTTNRWLLLQDFEQMLHSLVEQSTRFEKEINRKDQRLEEACQEIHQLRKRIPLLEKEESAEEV